MAVSLKAEMSSVYLHAVNLLSKVAWNALDGKYKQPKKFSSRYGTSFGKFGDLNRCRPQRYWLASCRKQI